MIITKRLFKPQRGIQLNRGHPLAKGLQIAYLFNEQSGEFAFDYSGNGRHIGTGTEWPAGVTSGPNGLELPETYTFNSTIRKIPSDDEGASNLGNWSCLFRVKPTVMNVGGYAVHFGQDDMAFTDNKLMSLGFVKGYQVNYWNVFGKKGEALQNWPTENAADTQLPGVQDEWQTVGWTQRGASVIKGFIDGIKLIEANGACYPSLSSYPLTGIRINGWRLDNADYDRDCTGDLDYVFFYNRTLTDEEMASISVNPYQIFQPSGISFDVAAAEGYSRRVFGTSITKISGVTPIKINGV